MMKWFLALIAVLQAVLIIASGNSAHPHVSRQYASLGLPYEHNYAFSEVGQSLLALAIQLSLTLAILKLRSYNHSWGRVAASASLPCMIVLVLVLFGDMHPSAPEVAYAQSALAAALMLILLACVEFMRARSR